MTVTLGEFIRKICGESYCHLISDKVYCNDALKNIPAAGIGDSRVLGKRSLRIIIHSYLKQTTLEPTLNLKYIDVDTREIIDVINDPSLVIYKVHAELYATSMGATVVRMTPVENNDEWTIELKIPMEVRRRQTPRPGERVRFTVKLLTREFEVSGFYHHKKNQFHIIYDDYGGEWKIESIWQLKKL